MEAVGADDATGDAGSVEVFRGAWAPGDRRTYDFELPGLAHRGAGTLVRDNIEIVPAYANTFVLHSRLERQQFLLAI